MKNNEVFPLKSHLEKSAMSPHSEVNFKKWYNVFKKNINNYEIADVYSPCKTFQLQIVLKFAAFIIIFMVMK